MLIPSARSRSAHSSSRSRITVEAKLARAGAGPARWWPIERTPPRILARRRPPSSWRLSHELQARVSGKQYRAEEATDVADRRSARGGRSRAEPVRRRRRRLPRRRRGHLPGYGHQGHRHRHELGKNRPTACRCKRGYKRRYGLVVPPPPRDHPDQCARKAAAKEAGGPGWLGEGPRPSPNRLDPNASAPRREGARRREQSGGEINVRSAERASSPARMSDSARRHDFATRPRTVQFANGRRGRVISVDPQAD